MDALYKLHDSTKNVGNRYVRVNGKNTEFNALNLEPQHA